MKRRIAIFSLVLVLALIAVLPGAALAGNSSRGSFSATGVITGIERTDVGENAFPLGDTGKWLVKDRDIYGSIKGDIQGDFTLTYSGIFSIETQAGCMAGTMTMIAGSRTFFVVGTIDPLQGVSVPGYGELPKLDISGYWTEKSARQYGRFSGRQTGTFSAWVVFVPVDGGHVGPIIDSSFEMNSW